MPSRETGYDCRGFKWMAAIGLTLALVLAGIMAGTTSSAQAKYRQANCAKFVKQFRKAKTAKHKRVAKRRFMACNVKRKAYNRVKDWRFVGNRSDGEPIDITLCANGISADNVGGAYEDVFRWGWRIDRAGFKGKYFRAGFAAKLKGGERVGALAFTKSGWQVGTYILGRLDKFGHATRTRAKSECRTLSRGRR